MRCSLAFTRSRPAAPDWLRKAPSSGGMLPVKLLRPRSNASSLSSLLSWGGIAADSCGMCIPSRPGQNRRSTLRPPRMDDLKGSGMKSSISGLASMMWPSQSTTGKPCFAISLPPRARTMLTAPDPAVLLSESALYAVWHVDFSPCAHGAWRQLKHADVIITRCAAVASLPVSCRPQYRCARFSLGTAGLPERTLRNWPCGPGTGVRAFAQAGAGDEYRRSWRGIVALVVSFRHTAPHLRDFGHREHRATAAFTTVAFEQVKLCMLSDLRRPETPRWGKGIITGLPASCR